MDVTGRIIKAMHKEEVRFYKLFASRIQTGDRKDVKLFDFIRKEGESYNEDLIVDKLYPGKTRNPYYRLRNRLTSDLNKCMLTLHYQEDEQSYVMLMLSAASYAQKPGPLFAAINGCCSYSLDDPASQRAADIKREALVMIARELNLPDAESWPVFELDPDIEAEVLGQRAAYVDEINQYSMEAFGEGWVK